MLKLVAILLLASISLASAQVTCKVPSSDGTGRLVDGPCPPPPPPPACFNITYPNYNPSTGLLGPPVLVPC